MVEHLNCRMELVAFLVPAAVVEQRAPGEVTLGGLVVPTCRPQTFGSWPLRLVTTQDPEYSTAAQQRASVVVAEAEPCLPA